MYKQTVGMVSSNVSPKLRAHHCQDLVQRLLRFHNSLSRLFKIGVVISIIRALFKVVHGIKISHAGSITQRRCPGYRLRKFFGCYRNQSEETSEGCSQIRIPICNTASIDRDTIRGGWLRLVVTTRRTIQIIVELIGIVHPV